MQACRTTYLHFTLPDSLCSCQRASVRAACVACALVAITASCETGRRASPEADGFPGTVWESAISVEELGWSPERIAALKPLIDSVRSSAFMIVTRGKVVAAWGDTGTTFLTHSIRKSFMSALAGIAAAEGKLDTSSRLGALGIGEKATPLTPVELQARVVDLLRARSGVYLAAAGEVDAMREARPERGSHPPGTFWYYNNWDFNVLGTIYRQVTHEDLFSAIDARIARPVGMQEHRATDGQYYTEAPSEHPGAASVRRLSSADSGRTDGTAA